MSLPEVNPLLGGVARSDGVGLGVCAKHVPQRAAPLLVANISIVDPAVFMTTLGIFVSPVD